MEIGGHPGARIRACTERWKLRKIETGIKEAETQVPVEVGAEV